MHSSHVSESTFTATTTTTAVIVSGVSQPESTAGQGQQSSFVGLSTTAHTPESTGISATYYLQDELRPLSDISTSQADPFDALATHQTVTLDDDHQGRSASSSSLCNEPARSQNSSQPSDDAAPIVREEQSPDPTDKWFMMSGDERRPYQCGYEGCGKKYTRKAFLKAHIIKHPSDSEFRCYSGNCSGTVRYRDKRALTRHIHIHHTFEKPFGCEICDRRFRRPDNLKSHREHMHSIKSKKKPPKKHSVSKSSSATSTSTVISGNSQPESTAGQRQQGSFVGLSTTVHTPESTGISVTYYQQDELGPLSNISTSQTDPFDALATHQTVTFDDDHQGRSASSLSLSNEPARSQKSSQPVDDVAPIVREEQSPDPTDKWIVMSGDETRPFQCGYEGCGKKYIRKVFLKAHIIKHPSDSEFRCYSGDCSGAVRYRDKRALTRHIHIYHTFEKLFGCEICDRRFRRPDHLKSHWEHMHSLKSKKKSPKRRSVPKLSSATSKNTIISGNSQPESTAGQRQPGSFIGLSRTPHTPESAHIPAADQHFSGLRLLAKVSTSQINLFEALATHQTVTFDDKAVTTGIAAVPSLPSDQYQAEQIPDSTDTNKWIMVDKSQKRPYICGYQGCDKTYLRKYCLKKHFVAHTGVSKFKCTYPECVGKECFRDRSMLNRHIIRRHTLEKPFRCDICERRFGRKDHMKSHKKNMHSAENEQKSPKRKRK